MKLSAPPPPPPPPDPSEPGPPHEPNEGAEPKAEQPTNPATPTEPIPSAAAEPAVPVEQPAPKPATWPAWFAGADVALAILVVGFAFLAASFAARNSDLWVHLGTGRMLTTGEYKLGSDPLSYTAADRPWVNHNWLFDLGAYMLYRGDGTILVVAKAVVVAVAFGLLLAIRRPGQPLWPWVVLAAIGVLAAAPQFTLRPLVGSIVFLALTLLLVFRLPSPPKSWRLPVAVGITFWFWANIDGWFILGPIAVGLLLAGELVRRQLTKGEPATDSTADPLGPLPDVATLTRALVIGVVACMLNPHHVRVWQVPFELLGLPDVEGDTRMMLYTMNPLRSVYWQNAGWGNNANGVAFAVLLAAGLYAAFLAGAIGRLIGRAAEVEPLPLPHVFLWVGFAALSLLTWVAIPFLAVVTVPLVASRLNLLSAGLKLGPWTDRRTRLLLTGAAAGRLASVVALLVLCLVAWPGWVHPAGSAWWEPGLGNTALARRVAWVVEPDEGLRRAAAWLQQAREGGRLPADTRGLVASIDLANYCAWFAPREKVFLNGRLNHHRPELPGFEQTRRGMGVYVVKEELPDLRNAAEVFARHKIGYAAVANGVADTEGMRLMERLASGQMWVDWENWSPWYVGGRAAISGWRSSPRETPPAFVRNAIDPVALAFGPRVERLPAGKAVPPPPPPTAYEEVVTPVRPADPGADEALAWLRYKSVIGPREGAKSQALQFLLAQAPPRDRIWTIPQAVIWSELEQRMRARGVEEIKAPWPAPGAVAAIPILAVRAARQAIAANPDHPDGYYALGAALADPGLPINPPERTLGMITAYRQCLSRLPPPDRYRPGLYTASPYDVAQHLAALYLGSRLPAAGMYRGARVDTGALGEIAGADSLFRIPGGPGTGGRSVEIRLPADRRAQPQLPPGTEQLPGRYLQPLDLARQALLVAEGYAKVELTIDAERRRELVAGLEGERKQVEAILDRVMADYRRVAEKQTRPRERYALALRAGLIGDALDILKAAKDNLDKEFGPQAVDVALQMIALELAVGRLEDAAADFAGLKAAIDEMAPSIDPRQLPVYRQALRELEYQIRVLEGDYGSAGAVYEDLEGGLGRVDPADYGRKFDPRPFVEFGAAWPLIPVLGATDGPFGVFGKNYLGQVQLQQYAVRRQQMVVVLDRQRTFFFRRGYLSLLEGDMPAAKKRFEQTTRTPPPGWDIPLMTLPMAGVYLRLIEEAEKKAAR